MVYQLLALISAAPLLWLVYMITIALRAKSTSKLAFCGYMFLGIRTVSALARTSAYWFALVTLSTRDPLLPDQSWTSVSGCAFS